MGEGVGGVVNVHLPLKLTCEFFYLVAHFTLLLSFVWPHTSTLEQVLPRRLLAIFKAYEACSVHILVMYWNLAYEVSA